MGIFKKFYVNEILLSHSTILRSLSILVHDKYIKWVILKLLLSKNNRNVLEFEFACLWLDSVWFIDSVSFLIKLPPRGMTSTQLLCRNFCETFKTFPHLLREDRAKLFMIKKISSYQVNVNESKDVYEKSKFTEIAFISWKMSM